MSKFSEMCQAYANSRQTYFEYRERCYSHFMKLGFGFAGYCEIPESQVRFIPLKEEYKSDRQYTLAGATHLDEDTYWHLGIKITLYEDPSTYPQQAMLIRLCVKELNGKIFVRIGLNDKPVEIDLSDETQCVALYENIINQIKAAFQNELQAFLEKSSPLKKIGF